MALSFYTAVGIPAGAGFTSACQGDSGGPQLLAGTTTQVNSAIVALLKIAKVSCSIFWT